jgi:hypothetical protein
VCRQPEVECRRRHAQCVPAQLRVRSEVGVSMLRRHAHPPQLRRHTHQPRVIKDERACREPTSRSSAHHDYQRGRRAGRRIASLPREGGGRHTHVGGDLGGYEGHCLRTSAQGQECLPGCSSVMVGAGRTCFMAISIPRNFTQLGSIVPCSNLPLGWS